MEETNNDLYYVNVLSSKPHRVKKLGGFFRDDKKFYWIQFCDDIEMCRVNAEPDKISGVFETYELANNYLHNVLKVAHDTDGRSNQDEA